MDKILVADLPSELEYIELYPVADIHVGDPTFKEKEFLKFVKDISQNENAYIILLGDLVNNAIKSSVSNVYNETMSPYQQKLWIVQALLPVKDKILAITGGNHELRSKKETDSDIAQDIAMMLGIKEKYSENEITIKIRLGQLIDCHNKKVTYNIYATHGYSGARRIGGAFNALEMAGMINENVDVYIVGHSHIKGTFKTLSRIYDDRNNNVIERERCFVITSSWTGYSGYAKRNMRVPSATGAVKIILSGKRKEANALI